MPSCLRHRLGHSEEGCPLCMKIRILELEAELLKCRWHKAHEEADAEIDLPMKGKLRAEAASASLRTARKRSSKSS